MWRTTLRPINRTPTKASTGARPSCAVAFMCVLLALHPPVNPSVRGMLVDTAGDPIAYARVTGGGVDSWTDRLGRFRLDLRAPGALRIDVRRIGFAPLEVNLIVTKDTTISVTMQPLPVSLAHVRIEAEASVRALEVSGFYERLRQKEKGANTGHFITAEDLEGRGGKSVTSFLQGVPGLRIVRFSTGSMEWDAAFGNSRCIMTVYLNGMRLPPRSENRVGAQGRVPPDIDEFITPREIAGIEVYSRSNAPVEYQLLNGTCGVILIWAR